MIKLISWNWKIWLALLGSGVVFVLFSGWQPEFVWSQAEPLECGWSCDPVVGPQCKVNKAGDTYEWIGYCADGSTGVCTDECVGRIDGPVSCNGQQLVLQCDSETKTSTGCCNVTPPGNSPVGVIEGWSTCERAIGWAYDEDEIDTSDSGEIKVEIYLDESDQPLVAGVAQLERSERPGGWQYVGFDIPLPNIDDGEHVLYAKAINLASGSDAWLSCWSDGSTPGQCERNDGYPGDGVKRSCGSTQTTPTAVPSLIVEPSSSE